MIRQRMTFFATIVTTALLGVMLLGVGAADARVPGWAFSGTSSNPTVGDPNPSGLGKYASYTFTLSNGGKSNISAVYVSTDIPASSSLAIPGYIFDVTWDGNPDGPTRPCGLNPPTGPLMCTLGAMPAGSVAHFHLLMKSPSTGGPYSFRFVANGNGNTPSDGGTSHGDTLYGYASVAVSGSNEYDGGYTLDTGGTFATGGTLGKNNPQTSSVTTPQSLVATTIEDLTGTYPNLATDPCTTANNCIGQWTRVIAPNPDNGILKVVLLVYGKGLGSVTAADINLIHVDNGGLDDGLIGDTANERCASATDSSVTPCIFVEAVGQNFRITGYLPHNGGLRGAY